MLSLWKGEVEIQPISMRDIACRVAERHGLTVDDLRGSDRTKRVAWPRQEAMAAIRETGRYSLPRIGKFFNRDHTTVIHAVRRVAERTDAG